MTERLLRTVGPLHIAGGLLVFLCAFSPAATRWLTSFFGMPADHRWSAFFIPIFGPTVASWGVLFGRVVRHFCHAPSLDQWLTMVLAIAVWAPLDTGLCLYFGLWKAAVLNAVITAALIGLLIAARRMTIETDDRGIR